MKMNMLAPIGVKLAFGSLMAVGLLASQHHAHAAAEPAGVQKLNTLSDGTAQVQSYVTAEIDGVTYAFPVCATEDCSDQPLGVGAWRDPDTGIWWISLGDASYPVHYSKMGGRVR